MQPQSSPNPEKTPVRAKTESDRKTESLEQQLAVLRRLAVSGFVSSWGYVADLGRNGWQQYYPGSPENCLEFVSPYRRGAEVFLVLESPRSVPPALRMIGVESFQDLRDLMANRLVCDGEGIKAKSGSKEDQAAARLMQIHLRRTSEIHAADWDLWQENRKLCYYEVVTRVLDADIDASGSVEARNRAAHKERVREVNERFEKALREFAESM